MKNALLAGLAAAIVLGPLSGQTLLTYDPTTARFTEVPAISPLYPAGGPPAPSFFPAAFPLPPAFQPALGAAPPGDCAVHSWNGMLFYSNGPQIAAMRHPAYPATIPPIPPFPVPPFPPPPCGVLCNGAWVTGMAVDPIGGVLWITNGYTVQGLALAPLPVLAVAVPPFVPAVPGVPNGLLSGLEWDGLTGSLWAVNTLGVVLNFAPGGAGIGALPPPFVVPPGSLATGVTVDKSAGVGIYVSFAPPMFVEYIAPALRPLPVAGFANGLAYHANPSRVPAGACHCPSFGPSGFQSLNPMTSGVAAWGVDWTGLPPFAPVFIGVDVVFNPGFPMINAVGCGLGLVLQSPSLGVVAAAANAAGRFSLPISLAGIPPLPPFYIQYATPCAADPMLGLVFSPLFQVAISGA